MNANAGIDYILDDKGLQTNEREIYVNEYQIIGMCLQLFIVTLLSCYIVTLLRQWLLVNCQQIFILDREGYTVKNGILET